MVKRTHPFSEHRPAVTPQSPLASPTKSLLRWARWDTHSQRLIPPGSTALHPASTNFSHPQHRHWPQLLSQRTTTLPLTQLGAQLPSSTCSTTGAQRASVESVSSLHPALPTTRVVELSTLQTTRTGWTLSPTTAGPIATRQATQSTLTTPAHLTWPNKTSLPSRTCGTSTTPTPRSLPTVSTAQQPQTLYTTHPVVALQQLVLLWKKKMHSSNDLIHH